MLVVGCKGLEGGDTESLTVDTNKEKRWQSSNTSTSEYVRYYKQFGSRNDVTEANIKISAAYPENGWSGFVFGLEKGEDNKSSFYVLGFKISEGRVYHYLSKFTDVNPEDVAKSTDKTLTGEEIIIDSSELAGYVAVKPLDLFVRFELVDDNEGGKEYKLSVGTGEYSVTPLTIPEAKADLMKTTAEGCGIGAYGQLTTATKEGTAIISDTTITVLSSQPENLRAAEDAE